MTASPFALKNPTARQLVCLIRGSGCGSVGRAVASDTRDPRFKPRLWQNFLNQIIYRLYIRKDKIKKKRLDGQSFRKKYFTFQATIRCNHLRQIIKIHRMRFLQIEQADLISQFANFRSQHDLICSIW